MAAARLGMRLAVEESELFQVRVVANFALGFGGQKYLGDSLPPQRTRDKNITTVVFNLHEPTSLAWSQFAKPGALTQIRRVLRALLRFWRSWPDVHYRMGRMGGGSHHL